MIIDFDSHLREGYFMDEVYKFEGKYERFRPVRLSSGHSHKTKFAHNLDPISPQGHAAHRHPYIYDPEVNWRGGEIARRQVGGYDMARRREDIRKEGIDKQVIFPTQITVATSNIGGLGYECTRHFNDWVRKTGEGARGRVPSVRHGLRGLPGHDGGRAATRREGLRVPRLAPRALLRHAQHGRSRVLSVLRGGRGAGHPAHVPPNSNGELIDRFDNFYKTHVLGGPPTAARRWWRWCWAACSRNSRS
jgi:hypothetical protein